MMKIVRVWMLLVVVMGVSLGGCETGESPQVHDVAPPSGAAVVKPPAPSSDTAARKPSGNSSPKASMNRLMREMEGVSPLPEKSRVAVRHPDDRPQPHAPASGSTGPCPPAWFRRGESSDFLEGIGGPAESRQAAEQAARLDVAKSIEVKTIGQDTVQARETTDQKFEYSVESTIVERVNLSLTGLSIPKVGTCDNHWYARAALDRAKAATAWREDLRRLGDEEKALSGHVATHTQNKAAFGRLLAQYRLAVVLETLSQIQRRLPRVTGKAESAPLRAGAAKDAKEHYESWLRSFHVKFFGDRQQAVEQATLPKPFGVQVLAGEDPVAGVPVFLTVTQGTIDVPDTARTDEDGNASVVGHYSKSPEDDASAWIDVAVRLDHMLNQTTNEDLSALKQAIEQKQKSFTHRFHVRPPVFHLRKKALQAVDEAKKLDDRIRDSRTKEDVLGVMEAMAKLYKVQDKGKPVVERLLRLHPDSGKDVDTLGAPDATLSKLKRLVSSFHFTLVNGDQQRAELDRPLNNALEARLVAKLGETDVPVSNVPVRFTFDQGRGTVKPRSVLTDEEGYVRASVRHVEPGDGNHVNTFVTASPDGTGPRGWLPESLHTGFITHLKENDLRFWITRPRGCVSANPFRGPLYKLACELVKDANESVGKLDENERLKKTVVRGFVERTSDDRHPLSDRIEEALRDGLTLTKQVKVLEPPSTPGDAVTPRDPDVEVSGQWQYWADARSLWVTAKLSRLTNHGKEDESVAEVTIPLKDVPRTEQSVLPSSAHDLPVLPDPSGFATHDEWVETFLAHRNPRAAFSTKVEAEQKVYQEGDHATFVFRTDRDCYLWVFAVDVKGNGVVLLPNFYQKDPPLIHAGKKKHLIPDPKEKAFKITIRSPFGVERVKTVCTTRSIDVVASGHVRALTAQSPLFDFSRENQRFRLVGGASLTGVTLDPGEWSEAHTTVITLPKGQIMTRGMRGLQDLGLVSMEEGR